MSIDKISEAKKVKKELDNMQDESDSDIQAGQKLAADSLSSGYDDNFSKQGQELNSVSKSQASKKKKDISSVLGNKSEETILKYIKLNYPDKIKEYNDFFFKEKRALPLINGSISLFGLFIIKQFLDCLFQKDMLKEKYNIEIKIDNVRAPATMQKMWDIASRSIKGFIASKDMSPIYFTSKDSVTKGYMITAGAISAANNKMWKTKQLSSKIRENSVVPVAIENYYNFPYFLFEKGNNILEKLKVLDNLIKEGTVKIIKFDSLKKKNWESFFSNLLYDSFENISVKEKEKFEFQKPKQIFQRFSTLNNVNKYNFFYCDNFKKIYRKANKTEKQILSLIYYSWVRLLIAPQTQKNVLEEYTFNMYSFISNTWIYNVKSPYLFKPDLFLTFVPYIRDLPDSKWNETEIDVILKNLYVHKNKNTPLSIRQLDMILFGKYTWTNINFVLRTIISLINNNFLKIKKDSFYLNPELEAYYDVLKSDSYKQLFDKIQNIINTYFTIDSDSLDLTKKTNVNVLQKPIITQQSESRSIQPNTKTKIDFSIECEDDIFTYNGMEISKDSIVKALQQGKTVAINDKIVILTPDNLNFTEIMDDEQSVSAPDFVSDENSEDTEQEPNVQQDVNNSKNLVKSEQNDKKVQSFLQQITKINNIKLMKK